MTLPLPRPWLKARTLWLSVLGFVLICGAWVDSQYHRFEMSTDTAPGGYIVHVRGALGVGIWDSSHGASGGKPYVRFQDRNPEFTVWFRLFQLDRPEGYNGWTVFFPHWLIFAIWTAVCGLLLLLRRARIRRHFAMLPSPTPELQP